jgi:hypothetical protein
MQLVHQARPLRMLMTLQYQLDASLFLTITFSDSSYIISAMSAQQNCTQYAQPFFTSVILPGHSSWYAQTHLVQRRVYLHQHQITQSQLIYSAGCSTLMRRAVVFFSVGCQAMLVFPVMRPLILLPRKQLYEVHPCWPNHGNQYSWIYPLHNIRVCGVASQVDKHTWQQAVIINPTVQVWPASPTAISREVILICLRIGHTCLAHGYPLCCEEAPVCAHHEAALTVQHIVIECPFYKEIHHTFHIQGNVQDVLQGLNSIIDAVSAYLHSIGLMVNIMWLNILPL